MTPFRRRLALLAAAFLAAGAVRSSATEAICFEDPKPAVRTDAEQIGVLRRKLASDDHATRAWGAWGASEALMRELAPDVLGALRRTLTQPRDEPAKFAIRALLDAAIRLGVRTSTEELAAIETIDNFGAQVIVLASRNPAAHTKLLEEVRAHSWHERMIAADNLLAQSAPARAVELFMPEARVHIRVRVVDPGSEPELETSTISQGCGSMTVPKDFPPTVRYALVRGPEKDAEVFAPGPQPIAMRRSVNKEREFPVGSFVRPFDTSEHALGLLRWITGDRVKASPLAGKIRIDHEWTNATDYVATVGDDILTRRAAWRTLVDALVARELLPAERVPTADPIDVDIEDLRKDQSVSLPELPR